MRRLLACLIMLCLVCGCSGAKGFPNRDANIAMQIGNEFDLSIVCFGTRQVDDGIVYIYGYNCRRILDESNARELLVGLARRLAADLQYEDTGEALGLSRLDLSIYFQDESSSSVYFPELGIVALREQEVEFAYWDPNDPYEFHTCTYETWDEALSKVNEQAQAS